MLLEFYTRIDQIPFEANQCLKELNLIEVDTPEWRFKLLIQILKYKDALDLYLEDRFEQWDLANIRNFLSEAISYRHTIKIVTSKLSQILNHLSYEFIKTNNNEFNYDLIKKYLTKQEIYDFLKSEIKPINYETYSTTY